MKPKIVLLNGPAGSGKDCIAKYIEATNPLMKRHSFKHSLIQIAAAIADIDIEKWECRYEIREFKENPWDELPDMRYMGDHFAECCGFDFDPDRPMSMREFLAYVSEIVIKPAMGMDFFGRAALKHCDNVPMPVYVFSDSGFQEEAQAFIDSDRYDIYVVKLHRGDLDFNGDSRDYLSPNDGFKRHFEAYNDTTIEAVSKEILRNCDIYPW